MEKSRIKRRLINVISNLNELISNTPLQARRRSELIKSRDEVQALLDGLNDCNTEFNVSHVREVMCNFVKLLFTWTSDD